MLTNLRKLSQYTIHTTDGEEIGMPTYFLFDSSVWLVKYMVAEMEPPFSDRHVKLSVDCLGRPDRKRHILPVTLSTREIEACYGSETIEFNEYLEDELPLESNGRLSELEEEENRMISGDSMADEPISTSFSVELEQFEKPELNSTEKVLSRFRVQSSDGEIGRIEDLVVDDHNWLIRYFIVSLRESPNRQVTISTEWCEYADMINGDVFIDMSAEVVNGSPEYKEAMGMHPNYEKKVQMHYDQSKHSRKVMREGSK
jgi:hypothetical protein